MRDGLGSGWASYIAKGVCPQTAAQVAAELRPMTRWPLISMSSYGLTQTI
jgi:hypothetical protein